MIFNTHLLFFVLRAAAGCAVSCVLLFGGIAGSEANAALMNYSFTDLANTTPGQDLWQYSYSVSGFTFAQNQGFSVFFDRALYTNLQSPPPVVNAGWDAITLQPDLGLGSNGIYDALAKQASPSLADPFTVNFVWLGVGTPGAQPFTIYDTNFAPIEQGQAIPTPEPGSATLLLSGLAILAGRRRGRAQRTGPCLTRELSFRNRRVS